MENKVLAAKVVLISWIIIIVTSLVMWIFDPTFLLSKSFILGGAVSLFVIFMAINIIVNGHRRLKEFNQ